MSQADAVCFPCPHCTKQLRAAAAPAGRTVRCPRCRGVTNVPGPLEGAEKQSSSGAPRLFWVGLAAAALLSMLGGGIGLWWVTTGTRKTESTQKASITPTTTGTGKTESTQKGGDKPPPVPADDKGGGNKPPPVPADDKGDIAQIQGDWKLHKIEWAEADSKKTMFVSSKYELRIKGNEMTRHIESDDGKPDVTKYTFDLDGTREPRVYKRRPLDGRGEAVEQVGIYVIEGDVLKLCSLLKGGTPRDFTIQQGVDIDNKQLYEFQRIKPSSLPKSTPAPGDGQGGRGSSKNDVNKAIAPEILEKELRAMGFSIPRGGAATSITNSLTGTSVSRFTRQCKNEKSGVSVSYCLEDGTRYSLRFDQSQAGRDAFLALCKAVNEELFKLGNETTSGWEKTSQETRKTLGKASVRANKDGYTLTSVPAPMFE